MDNAEKVDAFSHSIIPSKYPSWNTKKSFTVEKYIKLRNIRISEESEDGEEEGDIID
jgi:hypothetical protein